MQSQTKERIHIRAADISTYEGPPVAITLAPGCVGASYLPGAVAALADCGAPVSRGDLVILVENGEATLTRVAMPPTIAGSIGKPKPANANAEDAICVEIPGTDQLRAVRCSQVEGLHKVAGWVDESGAYRPLTMH